MTLRADLLPTLIGLALAAYGCRAFGYWLMRFVAVTPRIEAALRAAPLAVMIGIVAPVARHGHAAEAVGLAVTLLAMRLFRQDLLAAIAGVAAVALVRNLVR